MHFQVFQMYFQATTSLLSPEILFGLDKDQNKEVWL